MEVGFETMVRAMNMEELFESLGPIEKKIHMTWKRKDIFDEPFHMIQQGVVKMKTLNPEYMLELSDDADVEQYIRDHISPEDYNTIREKHIVEKTDLWRLLKIYNEGGIYMDLDRFCNIPLRDIVKDHVKCILPFCENWDFSQDLMVSCSKNPMYKRAIELNLERRRRGVPERTTRKGKLFYLGPITYFHAVTEVLLGYQMERTISPEMLKQLHYIIDHSKYVDSYVEHLPFDSLVYRGDPVPNDKDEFYASEKVKSWGEGC